MAEYVAKRDRKRRPGVASIRINFRMCQVLFVKGSA